MSHKCNYVVTLLLAIFFGTLGIHRFYAGKVVTGLLMLLTCGGFLIWWIIDCFVILFGAFKDKQNHFIKP